ncbi:hypothetical protein A1Q2_08050 [Trichosporon asahii var. asahii CBS 8904]|uniref:Uncharacterized protein n=1 Tax=Trichosporon asahii var. asahii (strain CBS 8904) TaxID=1220162 RepID=K1V198_TRIAC|nr:hypothetical protein A1Q2_08050 [Trichosporon asahii var. asahii CBS 8904]
MPNAWSQFATSAIPAQEEEIAQEPACADPADTTPLYLTMEAMSIGETPEGEPRYLVKAKVCIPEGTQLAAPRISAEPSQEEEFIDIAFLFRLASDGKLELHLHPDSVLTQEQADNLDENLIAVKWEPREEIKMFVTVPDLTVLGFAGPGWPTIDKSRLATAAEL